MTVGQDSADSNLDIANRASCLVHFLDLPVKYKRDDLDLVIDYYSIADLPEKLQSWTFELVKTNLHHMYVQSNDGWSDEGKKTEMRSSNARYLIARSASDPHDLKGFLLFQMVSEETMDDDVMAQVAYCYEIQLVDNARNRGLGEYLMSLLYQIGSHWKMDKVMLTVFKANEGAFRFYQKLGYELDEISPGACLSKRLARKFDYELLSKPCVQK
ncbi:N-alpha-acetyltransferase 40 [Apophysomyces sp. BC1034]|nr:N-alpha-acetyltransferase 40 [Apophysomyces sp. BC1015]KAG0173463.1 N-alpha-acetyltransferase 40 [Apophysomyces sp. BC1021]KAG0188093.1 N-alpha-acetyltransferase 40 [Apophysomyces sp. BC1034]